MSDWEIDNTSNTSSPSQAITNVADWEVMPEQISQSGNNSSLGYSALTAPFKILLDEGSSLYHMVTNLPQDYRQAKIVIPEAINAIKQDPLNAARQIGAGFPELGHALLNVPSNIAQYTANRLNLISPETAQQVPHQRDITSDINQWFGTPQNEGQNVLRNVVPDAFKAIGTFEGASALNPLQLTNKGIAKSVVNELNNQVDKHSAMYDNLWNKADQQGFNQVPFDRNALNQDVGVFGKSYTDKQMKSVNNLLQNPTLENAQKAQSDIGQLRRALEEKSKSGPLFEGEKDIYRALSSAEDNIEGNMFKNSDGDLNTKLKNQYDKISNSYRQNVVPYKYNPDIQDYLSKDITEKQLVQRLQQGPFAAKKGDFLTHPQFAIRNALLPIGGLSALGTGVYLYNNAMGNPVAENK